MNRNRSIIAIILLIFILIVLGAVVYNRQDEERAKTMEDSQDERLVKTTEVSQDEVDRLFHEMGIIRARQVTEPLEFSLFDITGRKVSLSHFRGKVVFLNFWAT